MSTPFTRALRPLRLLLPFVVIGMALVLFLTVGFLAFSPNIGGRQSGADWCDTGISTATAGRGGNAGATIETLTDEQKQNASAIISVAKDMDLPPRAWLVALATAMQESTLRNIDYGDRDSLGLFQQRPSMGWGTPAEVTDPAYSSRIFYERLLEVPGWDSMPVTVAAQTVQRSAFPDAYAKWEPLAVSIVEQIGDVTNPTGCEPGTTGALPPGAAGAAIGFALGEVGKPYVWGATGPNAYDCSGLLLRAYEAAGMTIPRVSRDQYNSGGHLPVQDVQPGDFLFYAHDPSDPSTIYHVTMFIGDDKMVEAPNKDHPVRVQPVPWDFEDLVPLATRPGTTPNPA
ncbi:NlpC/P60 family protein [Pseudonocardia ammonioxydans]|uniref:NlpC/P60 family protein n=1 Tax=Pseudonocardia ammonioxydans TaxID=260086 RepID=A0A1I4X6T1_PSUAM|nr:C40 family peptidase [Pseudonocardia ammonioxydans]SFN21594.1 NlpC/P60 family protein [Pseudonocardia ammonioxydans]